MHTRKHEPTFALSHELNSKRNNALRVWGKVGQFGTNEGWKILAWSLLWTSYAGSLWPDWFCKCALSVWFAAVMTRKSEAFRQNGAGLEKRTSFVAEVLIWPRSVLTIPRFCDFITDDAKCWGATENCLMRRFVTCSAGMVGPGRMRVNGHVARVDIWEVRKQITKTISKEGAACTWEHDIKTYGCLLFCVAPKSQKWT